MDALKKIFPLSFKFTDGIGQLIIGIIVYLVVGFLGGLLIGLAGSISLPLLGLVCRICGFILDAYILVGIVLQVLAFFKVID